MFWRRLLACLASPVVESLSLRLEFVLEENRILRKRLQKRIRLNDAERISLALRGKALGRKALGEVCSLVSPDTILRWHRKRVAAKFDTSDMTKKRPVGRPSAAKAIEAQVVSVARDNRRWGYAKISAALKYLGHNVSASTVGRILKKHDLPPAKERDKSTPWHVFLKTHAEALWACDFFTAEVWTLRGLVTFHTLFFIHLKTRRVVLGGVAHSPDETWIKQIARNATMADDGFLKNGSGLIHDRDALFTASGFQFPLREAGVALVTLPPRSPNLNAYAERFVRSIRDECLNKIIPLGETHFRKTVAEYVDFYNAERPHQGADIGNELLIEKNARENLKRRTGSVRKKERLGGLLSFYYRAVA